MTATLSGKSSAAVTVTVAAVAGTGAVAADFALSNAATLTIAAGSTTSAGLVTVTANGNAVDSPNKSVTVSGTAAGGNGVANPPNVTLTLTDDDALPTVALKLSDSSISETGRGIDGDGDAFGGVERRCDGDGGGCGGDRRGRGGLRPVERGDADDRGGFDDERGPGDGDGERQRGGFSEQVGDGLRGPRRGATASPIRRT